MTLIIIKVITFIIIYLYNKFLINYYGKIIEIRNRKLARIFPIIISTISMMMICGEIFTPFVYMIIFLEYMVLLKMIFSESIGTIYSLAMNQVFHMLVYRDIVIGCFSIFFSRSMYQTIKSKEVYILSFALCRLLMLIKGINFGKICNLEIAKKMLINRKKLRMITLTITSLVIILLNSNYTYYYSGDISTTTYIMIINRICIIFCFYFAVSMGIKSINWVEDELFYKTNLLNLEYNNNLNKKVDEYSNLLRMYNHDFSNILLNINDSIEIGDIERAKEIIHEFDGRIQGLSDYNKKLSNHSLINAILNRVCNECNNSNIHFDSDCYIPEEFSISELDLINIFNNLSSNAFEACDKQENNDKKWISFKSYVKENNLIIYQSNSFNGDIKFRNDKLITTKKNKKLHGIGVESIKHIVDEANGMALIKVDKGKNEFKFLIKIPL